MWGGALKAISEVQRLLWITEFLQFKSEATISPISLGPTWNTLKSEMSHTASSQVGIILCFEIIHAKIVLVFTAPLDISQSHPRLFQTT